MGQVHIAMFATLDLVGQAPGGPDEDPDGFDFGGWQTPLIDDVSEAQVGAAYEGTDALLLGRRTYDIFAAHWHEHIKVVGSLNLVQTLLREKLFPNGIVFLRYGLAEGTPGTGDMSAAR